MKGAAYWRGYWAEMHAIEDFDDMSKKQHEHDIIDRIAIERRMRKFDMTSRQREPRGVVEPDYGPPDVPCTQPAELSLRAIRGEREAIQAAAWQAHLGEIRADAWTGPPPEAGDMAQLPETAGEVEP